MSLRKQLIKLAYKNPEIRDDLLPLLEETKTAKQYPSPKELAKDADKAAKAIFDMRGKALSKLQSQLQYAIEDATGSGVAFKGDTATKFGKRMKEIKGRLNKADSAIMDVAGSLEALARDLKKAK